MPYDPGVVNRSGEILAQGRLAGGMAALGGISQGIQTYQKNKLQNQVLSNENDALIAGLQQLQQMGGGATMSNLAPAGMEKLIQKHLEGGGLNLSDSMKLNSMLNTTLKTAQVGQQMQAQQMQAQVNQQRLMNEIATGRQAQADVVGIGKVLQELSGQGEVTLDKVVSAASKVGLSPGAIDSLTQSLGRMQPKAGPATAAQQDTEAIIRAEIEAGTLSGSDAGAVSKRRAELLALGGRGERQTERFQSPTSIVDASGNYLGQAVFDQKTAEFGLRNPETGKIEPLPKGAKPSTVSGMSRAMLAGPQFLKLRDDLGQAEVALNRLSAYMSSVENSRQGFEKLADKFATNFKTLLNSGALTKEQLATAAATGQLQSLLGANRLEMLGGGVLTENDALRIIAAAGGDVNALQNKEIVQEAIARMYNDKYRTYQRNREDYNIQVKGGYGGQGYAEAEKVEFDPRFLKDAAPAATTQVKQGTLSEIRARIEALKKKAGGTK